MTSYANHQYHPTRVYSIIAFVIPCSFLIYSHTLPRQLITAEISRQYRNEARDTSIIILPKCGKIIELSISINKMQHTDNKYTKEYW